MSFDIFQDFVIERINSKFLLMWDSVNRTDKFFCSKCFVDCYDAQGS